MNENEQAELDGLKRRQEALQAQLSTLAGDIIRLEARFSAHEPGSATAQIQETHQSAAIATPPPLPPQIPAIAAMESVEAGPRASAILPAETVVPVEPFVPRPKEEKTSLEVRVGTYWLVRVGIVMLLTGLVFLGTYAYKNYIGKLGASGKLTLLYSAAAGLLAAGAWLQRRHEKEGLRNYGQVLFAGGLATVYFATYAAHYIPVLRVISSAVVDGLLLLAWAAVIAFIADRKKSEILAIFGFGLAYYTSAITDVGLFTLYSNLVLTCGAVFFLIRHRWAALPIISLVATYGGFAFWRFYHGDWGWDARSTDLIPANGFLGGYWLLFTAAVFASRSPKLARENRVVFATVNNAAFFSLVLLSMIHVSHGHFWQFAIGFGAVVLGAAVAARGWMNAEPLLKNTYLVQGVVLVTMGLIAKFSGLRLALVLSMESAVLIFLAGLRRNTFLRVLGCVCAMLSATWVGMGLLPGAAEEHWLLGTGIGALLGLGGFLQSRTEPQSGLEARPGTSLLCALALFAWGATTWQAVPEQWRPVAMCLEAMLLTISIWPLRIPEVPLLGQSFLIIAQCDWMYQTLRGPAQPWWAAASVLAATVALSHWWQIRQRLDSSANKNATAFIQALYASAVMAILFLWLHPKFQPSSWLAFANLLALALTLYAVLTRSWILAAVSQAFALIGAWEFARQLIDGRPEWYFAMAPVATWLVLGAMTAAWIGRRTGTPAPVLGAVQNATMLYRWIALGMSLWWIHVYIPARFQFAPFVLIGVLLAGLALWRRVPSVLLFAAAYFVAGFVSIAIQLAVEPQAAAWWLNAAMFLVIFAIQQAVRRCRLEVPNGTHEAAIATAAAVLWLFVSRWVSLESGGGHILTASWAALAFLVFSSGFVLRERMYRWFGLAILACAIGRVFLFDVWKLETLFRILSFLALGIVLLVLGFIYNKYQDKWREWL